MISRSPRAISLPLSPSLSLSLVPSRTCCVCWLNLDTLNFHYILMEITHLFMAPSMDDADTEIASSSPPSPFLFPLSPYLPFPAPLGYYTNSPQSIAQHTFCVPNVHTFAPATYPSPSLQPAAPFSLSVLLMPKMMLSALLDYVDPCWIRLPASPVATLMALISNGFRALLRATTADHPLLPLPRPVAIYPTCCPFHQQAPRGLAWLDCSGSLHLAHFPISR